MNKSKEKDNSNKTYFCKKCSVVEDNEMRYIRHLRTHFRGNRRSLLLKQRDETPSTKLKSNSSGTSLGEQLNDSIPVNITNLLNDSILQEDICERLVQADSAVPSQESVDLSFEMKGFLSNNDSVKSLIIPDNSTRPPVERENDVVMRIGYVVSNSPNIQNETCICHICKGTFSKNIYMHGDLTHENPQDNICKECFQFASCETIIVDEHRELEKKSKKITSNDKGSKTTENNSTTVVNTKNKNKSGSMHKLSCDVCAKVFKKRQYLNRHRKLCEQKSKKANKAKQQGKATCNKKIPDKTYRKNVLNNKELQKSKVKNKQKPTPEGMFTCAYCNSTIKFKHSMTRHLKCLHQDHEEEWSKPNFIDSLKSNNNTQVIDKNVMLPKQKENNNPLIVPIQKIKKGNATKLSLPNDTDDSVRKSFTEAPKISDEKNINAPVFKSNDVKVGQSLLQFSNKVPRIYNPLLSSVNETPAEFTLECFYEKIDDLDDIHPEANELSLKDDFFTDDTLLNEFETMLEACDTEIDLKNHGDHGLV